MDQQINQPVHDELKQKYTRNIEKNSAKELNMPLSVGQFIIMDFISLIPVLNVIMIVIWAFKSNINTNKKNYSRALLINFLFLYLVIWFVLLGLGVKI